MTSSEETTRKWTCGIADIIKHDGSKPKLAHYRALAGGQRELSGSVVISTEALGELRAFLNAVHEEAPEVVP